MAKRQQRVIPHTPEKIESLITLLMADLLRIEAIQKTLKPRRHKRRWKEAERMRRDRAVQIAALYWVLVPNAPIELLGFDSREPLPRFAPPKRGRRKPWTLTTPVDLNSSIEPPVLPQILALFATVNFTPAQSEMLRLLLRNEPAMLAVFRAAAPETPETRRNDATTPQRNAGPDHRADERSEA